MGRVTPYWEKPESVVVRNVISDWKRASASKMADDTKFENYQKASH